MYSSRTRVVGLCLLVPQFVALAKLFPSSNIDRYDFEAYASEAERLAATETEEAILRKVEDPEERPELDC